MFDGKGASSKEGTMSNKHLAEMLLDVASAREEGFPQT